MGFHLRRQKKQTRNFVRDEGEEKAEEYEEITLKDKKKNKAKLKVVEKVFSVSLVSPSERKNNTLLLNNKIKFYCFLACLIK